VGAPAAPTASAGLSSEAPQATAGPPVPDPQFVEDWVDPNEPAPVLPATVPGWRATPLPGEPVEAVPWRVLAEERVDAARGAWEAGQPRPLLPLEVALVEDADYVRTRDELPPEALQPATEEGPSWAFGARCLWRDVEAFLTKIP
jgi:hypothetical protein